MKNDCNPISIPINPNVKISKEMCPKSNVEEHKMKKMRYQSLIGSLLYLDITLRPDIAYAVSFFKSI